MIAEIDGLSGIILSSLGNRMAVFVNREFVGSADDNLYLKKVAEENEIKILNTERNHLKDIRLKSLTDL